MMRGACVKSLKEGNQDSTVDHNSTSSIRLVNGVRLRIYKNNARIICTL